MWPVAGSARPCVSRQAALSMSVWFFFHLPFMNTSFLCLPLCPWKAICFPPTLWLSDQVTSAKTQSHCHLSRTCHPLTPNLSLSLPDTNSFLVVLSSRAPYLILSLTSLWPSHTCLLVPLITFFLRLFPLSPTLALQFFNLLLPCHLSSLLLFSFP